MKAGELFQESMSEYTLRLVQRLNIKRLGQGAYAQVFQHPTFSNVVVKVYTGRDKSYHRYVKWCEKNQGNPYVPKIIATDSYKPEGKGAYHLVFMEKMQKMSNSQFVMWLNRIFGQPTVDAYDALDFRLMRDEMAKVIETSKDKNFKNVWTHIMSYPRAEFDVHASNVMLRNDHVVFTDPVGRSPVQ